MKIVILAAGMGSRLGSSDIPKPLTPLYADKSILGLQLDHIARYTSLDHVLLVVGYRKEQIIQRFPAVAYVENLFFSQENTSKSLLRAIRDLNEDVIWINGDVVFHPSVIKSLLAQKRSCMVVNCAPTDREEIKYRTDQKGRVLEVSKEVKLGEGEAVGLNYLTAQDLSLFKHNLDACKESDYFEKGLELCIQQGMSLWTLPIDAKYSMEIDFPQDLVNARQLIQDWGI